MIRSPSSPTSTGDAVGVDDHHVRPARRTAVASCWPARVIRRGPSRPSRSGTRSSPSRRRPGSRATRTARSIRLGGIGAPAQTNTSGNRHPCARCGDVEQVAQERRRSHGEAHGVPRDQLQRPTRGPRSRAARRRRHPRSGIRTPQVNPVRWPKGDMTSEVRPAPNPACATKSSIAACIERVGVHHALRLARRAGGEREDGDLVGGRPERPGAACVHWSAGTSLLEQNPCGLACRRRR